MERQVSSETDFVGRNEDFQSFVLGVAEAAVSANRDTTTGRLIHIPTRPLTEPPAGL